MTQINVMKFIPGIAWFFVVLVLLCMPGQAMPTISWLDKFYFDKWVHMGIFGLLALLFMMPVALSSISHKEQITYLICIAIATSVWGLTTEFIQKYLVINRAFDLLDWVADSFGALASFIFCRKTYVKKIFENNLYRFFLM